MKRTRLRRLGKRKMRDLEALKLFREGVLARDNYECQRCGERRNLHPHHILPKSRGGTNDVENGVTLCFTDHRLIHDHAVPDWRDWIR